MEQGAVADPTGGAGGARAPYPCAAVEPPPLPRRPPPFFPLWEEAQGAGALGQLGPEEQPTTDQTNYNGPTKMAHPAPHGPATPKTLSLPTPSF